MNPPIPTFKNKVLEQYSKPKVFEEFGFFDTENEDQRTKMNYFDGWSFVKTTDDTQQK